MASNSQLEMAIRRNRGNQMLAHWMSTLTQACHHQVSPECFLSLEETEALKRSFISILKTDLGIVRQNFPKNSLRSIVDLLNDLAIELRETPVVLFSNVDQYVGGVQLPASFVLPNFCSVWDVVQDDFCATTLNLQSGLCVELNHYRTDGVYVEEGVYELARWGIFIQP